MCFTVLYLRFLEVTYFMLRAWLHLISQIFRIMDSCCAAWTEHRPRQQKDNDTTYDLTHALLLCFMVVMPAHVAYLFVMYRYVDWHILINDLEWHMLYVTENNLYSLLMVSFLFVSITVPVRRNKFQVRASLQQFSGRNWVVSKNCLHMTKVSFCMVYYCYLLSY